MKDAKAKEASFRRNDHFFKMETMIFWRKGWSRWTDIKLVIVQVEASLKNKKKKERKAEEKNG